MPYNDPDPTDPNMLVGVELPADIDTTEDMAYVFAEEFARLGFDKNKIMRLFLHPFYAGSHRAYQELGAKRVEEIVDECLAIWGKADKKCKMKNGKIKNSGVVSIDTRYPKSK